MAESRPALSIRETLTSITIAFALAFVFRAFVIEAFIIPTGSMAPTLLGAHMRFRADQSGYDWSVNPWRYQGQSGEFPHAIQDNIQVNDPMTGQPVQEARVRRRAGDRILVLKYLIPFGIGPSRFDAVVFKNPSSPQQNFIKRLLGLPGEQVALVDGDVFVRDAGAPTTPGVNLWALDGWRIARKWDPDRGNGGGDDLHGERIQRELWTPVYSSEYAPLNPTKDGRTFTPPWRPRRASSGWDTTGRAYTYDGAGPTTLVWDTNLRPIVDRFPYNQTEPSGAPVGWRVPSTPRPEFPVADLRMRCGVEASAEGLEIAAVLTARGHEFRARFTSVRAVLDMRPAGGRWRTDLAEADMPAGAFRPGSVTNIEFWHVDQTLHVLAEGERIASFAYGDDWSPAQRLAFATGRPFAELMAQRSANPLANAANYVTPFPQPRWEIAAPAAPVTLHRVALDRDIFYQPGVRESGQPYWCTHPDTTRTLTGEQYFVCGDNSANSSDARAWEGVDPWVGVIDDTPGVVPEKLMIGKAFFVYFPSMVRGQVPVPAPDFGRMRWIW